MSVAVDYIDDLVQLLLANATVTAIVESRVFGELFPRLDPVTGLPFKDQWTEKNDVKPFILIRESESNKSINQIGPTIEFHYSLMFFGDSQGTARNLASVVRAQFHDQYELQTPGPNERVFKYIKLQTIGQGGVDADTSWEYFMNQWNATLFID